MRKFEILAELVNQIEVWKIEQTKTELKQGTTFETVLKEVYNNCIYSYLVDTLEDKKDNNCISETEIQILKNIDKLVI